MAEPQKIWIEQCDATATIERNFGVQPALDYLIGEKFLDFLEAAESEEAFREEIPAFVTRVRTIFKRSQLAAYLGMAESELGTDVAKGTTEQAIYRCTRDVKLVEQAQDWLLAD